MKDRSINAKSIIFVIFLALTWGIPAGPAAHEVRPAIADLTFDGNSGYRVSISLNLEALIAEIGPEHDDTATAPNAVEYNKLRKAAPAELRAGFDKFRSRFLNGLSIKADGEKTMPAVAGVTIPPVGDIDLARLSKIEIVGMLPPDAKTLTWTWDKNFGASVIRVRGPKSSTASPAPVIFSAYLQNGAESKPIPIAGGAAQSVSAIFVNYLVIGFTHILPKGLDHILFVVGLFLLSTSLRSLAWQITSFTIAHSVTLALGIYGVVQISPAIVEPLIAASIVYVCIENIVTDKLQAWRPFVVFGFGLLHGLGFAGVLTEIGLQPAHFIIGLIAFNLGVEFGQLAVIAICFLAVGLWFRHKDWYRPAITIPASLVIAVIGAWWFVERSFFG